MIEIFKLESIYNKLQTWAKSPKFCAVLLVIMKQTLSRQFVILKFLVVKYTLTLSKV